MQHCKIICIGQNYRAHVQEMRSTAPPEPMLFLKPSSAIIGDGEVIEAGPVGRVDHEVELALIIGRTARKVAEAEALSHISHLAVFNDITARDMQSVARNAGNPWTLSKGMDTFAPMSRPVPISRVRDVHDLDLELRVNGEVRQKGNTGDMIFGPEVLVSYISGFITLEPGDIIATGTPEGVSPLNDGDRVEASIPGVGAVRNAFRRI
jgi:2-keto-4-pentenoate hydratase/2-oxohepta-3-ene-1,7-dioic acid hydratase in catechol pathway